MKQPAFSRRGFLGATALSAAALGLPSSARAAEVGTPAIVLPPQGKRVLLSCKLTMIAKESGGKKLSLTERLRMAADAGFDGVDLDEAGTITAEQAMVLIQALLASIKTHVNDRAALAAIQNEFVLLAGRND